MKTLMRMDPLSAIREYTRVAGRDQITSLLPAIINALIDIVIMLCPSLINNA